jgi:tetraacyldisaccharide 4'-kinase
MLRPFSWLYRLVMSVRRAGYSLGLLRSGHPGVPVIVVGNVSVGGTGKTPLALWLAGKLRDRGHIVGIATRGYGGRARGTHLVSARDSALESGDEAVLLARRSGCLVCVAARRLEAARELVRRGCNVILCDDGLQHLALRRELEIAVVDGARGLGNGWMLPAGPLREPARRIGEVDLVVVNGSGFPVPGIAADRTVHMRLEPGMAVSLVDGEKQGLGAFRGRRVHAFAGIGNPDRFFSMLRGLGLECREQAFDDHHPFELRDFATGDQDPILMTEKDAVKCAPFADRRMWYVPVTAHLADADAARLLGAVSARLSGGGAGA